MPLYEYECEDGHKFEALKSIKDRYNAVCPMCKSSVHIKPSAWGRVLVAGIFTTVGYDGTVLGKRQTTERIPMVVTPSGREY